MNVNEQVRLSNSTLKTQIKASEQRFYCCLHFSHIRVLNLNRLVYNHDNQQIHRQQLGNYKHSLILLFYWSCLCCCHFCGGMQSVDLRQACFFYCLFIHLYLFTGQRLILHCIQRGSCDHGPHFCVTLPLLSQHLYFHSIPLSFVFSFGCSSFCQGQLYRQQLQSNFLLHLNKDNNHKLHTFRATIYFVDFSLARQTFPNFPFPRGLPMSKSSRDHLFLQRQIHVYFHEIKHDNRHLNGRYIPLKVSCYTYMYLIRAHQ